VYVPSSELGHPQPLSRQRVWGGGAHSPVGWGSPNSDDWRKKKLSTLPTPWSLLFYLCPTFIFFPPKNSVTLAFSLNLLKTKWRGQPPLILCIKRPEISNWHWWVSERGPEPDWSRALDRQGMNTRFSWHNRDRVHSCHQREWKRSTLYVVFVLPIFEGGFCSDTLILSYAYFTPVPPLLHLNRNAHTNILGSKKVVMCLYI